ncbi:MAG TPA: guanine deaminase [Steroidobacteraceae bacterium]|nr:guanine deaminase [Steroidobacteraceae bacterium]
MTQAFRGSILHFLDDPGAGGDAGAYQYFEDGLLVVEDGHVAGLGPAPALLPRLPQATPVANYAGKLILPGFVDAHVHAVQTDVIGAWGSRLIEWLDKHTYPAERAFADPAHAREVAGVFVEELLRNGTTTALVMGSVHAASVDAVFEAGQAQGMRLIAGKVMMDRNCPEWLRDTAETGYAESKALIGRWHGRGRMQYAISPRFAPSCSPEQLAAAGRLAREHPDAYVHTHVAESEEEVAWVRTLFPERRSYLDVYDHFGLLRRRTLLAHGIWLDDADRARLAATGAALVHCPCCNLFIGSGLFDLGRTLDAGVAVALGTDVGGGTSFGLLAVMHDAYKVAQLRGHALSPLRAFYLATLAGARALGLEDRIGSFQQGREADFVVLDPGCTPLLARRTAAATDIAGKLFLLMTLGDDRAVAATWVMGRLRHARTADSGSGRGE